MKLGYKQTEVGVIPEEWYLQPIGQVVHEFRGGAPLKPSDFQSSGVKVLPKGGVGYGGRLKIREKDLQFCAEAYAASHPRNQVNETYTIVVLRDLVPSGPSIGLMVQIKEPENFVLAQGVYGFKTNANAASGYLVQVSNTAWYRKLVNSIMVGSTQVHITNTAFKLAEIPLPPIAEQDAIAEALSDADALIESLAQLLAKKRDLKQGAMQELLTGKRRLPGFNEQWLRKQLAEIFSFSGGFSASRAQLSSSGHCYLHYGDIHTSDKTHIDIQIEQADIPRLDVTLMKVRPASLIEDGDVVFVDASEDDEGTSRHIVVVNPNAIPFISGLHTIVAKGRADVLCPLYRRYCFQTLDVKAQFRFYAVGTKVSGISKTNIGKIAILVPPVDEQAAIATILSDIDNEIAALESKLTKARQLKQGMMQELLTGRIRLVPTSSNVVSLPVKQVEAKSSGGEHNSQINEAVVLSILTHRFGSEQYPLGRFRRTKLTYLLHRHVEHEAQGFMKKAAGPYNPQIRYGGAEKIAIKNGYVRQHKSGQFEGFVAADNIDKAHAYFDKWYGADVLKWLDKFKFKKKDELELLTTVDMAMHDLIKQGQEANLESVKMVIKDHPEWTPKLDRAVFSDDNIVRAMAECRALFDH